MMLYFSPGALADGCLDVLFDFRLIHVEANKADQLRMIEDNITCDVCPREDDEADDVECVELILQL